MKRRPNNRISFFFVCVVLFFNNVSSNFNTELFSRGDVQGWLHQRIKRQGVDIKECAWNEFRCDYVSCIKKSLICNGAKDCANGVDETSDLCGSNKCSEGEFRCEYGACVTNNSLCDGHNQCADASDEDWNLCQNFTCPPDTFRCSQGICLDKGRLCDGDCSCHGCGDETKDLCQSNVCPKNKFRCDYGGCLDDNQLCDGFSSCKDGADENVKLCGNRTCPEDRFRCSNGVCIYRDNVCDGHCHCSDCIDETAEQCENNKCPTKGRIFRCDYGGCLYQSHVCNGVKNCADNSDEDENLCKKKINKDQNTCTVPAKTADRKYSLHCRSKMKCENRPGKRVEQYSRIIIQCAEGYYAEGEKKTSSFCIGGQWIPPVPRCEKRCEPLTTVNEELTCFRNRRSAPVGCDSPLLRGSVVFVRCKEAYRPPGNKKLGISLTCNEDGTWSDKIYTCEPDCGKSFGGGKNLIVHGKEEVSGDSPWNVAIYSTATSKNPELICGATIISENLIVSAAHCFRDDFGNPYSETNFVAVVAKLSRGYNLTDSSHMKRYTIKKIFYPPEDFSSRGFEIHRGDIALLQIADKIEFNKLVVPACVDWTASGPFIPTQTFNGKLVGWGHDASGKPSNVLLSALMPFVSKSRCKDLVNVEFKESIKEDKFCAGSLRGAGARPGDSGAGLLFRDVHTDTYVIRGIVSSKDTSNTSLATFTDIGLFLDWIETVKYEINSE